MVAPEGFQPPQRLVVCLTPELARSFEAALGLPTRCFNRPAADGFAPALSGAIVHALPMFVKIVHLPGHHCLAGWSLSPVRAASSCRLTLTAEWFFN